MRTRSKHPVLYVIPAFLVACGAQPQGPSPMQLEPGVAAGAPVLAGTAYAMGVAGEQRAFQLQVHEAGASAAGVIISTDMLGGGAWVASASCVRRDAESGTAFVGGRVTEGDTGAAWVMLAVRDGGDVGVGQDRVFSGVAASQAELDRFCAAPSLAKLSSKWEVYGGDLTVLGARVGGTTGRVAE